jgi:sigma-B regulation protein RsbU (phosphoserine phosphatase)
MTHEDAVELVRELEQAVNLHDTARVMRLYADDAIAKSPLFPEIVGGAAIAKNFESIFVAFPDWTVHVKDVLADGDRVVFMGGVTATDHNGWFHPPATGERIEYQAIIVLGLQQGKIVRDERIYDLAGVLQRLERAQLAKELKMASDVQHILLSRKTHRTAYCDVAADSIPCRAIGGDFFEFVPLGSNGIAIALGDVSGKGSASALLAAMTQGMLTLAVENESNPSAVLRRLNRMLVARGLQPHFVTLVYGVLSTDGKFVYSNAGHNPPMVVAEQKVRRLTTGGPALGMFAGAAFEEETVVLRDADTIILFSDGVTEACNAEEQEFGDDRLTSCVTRPVGGSAQDLLQQILTSARAFCAEAPQSDDITVTVVRFRDPK